MIRAEIAWLILGCAAVTQCSRLAPLCLPTHFKLPSALLRWLPFVPVAMFSALLARELDLHRGVPLWENMHVLGIACVFCASWITRSILIAVLVGVVVMQGALWWGA